MSNAKQQQPIKWFAELAEKTQQDVDKIKAADGVEIVCCQWPFY